MSASEGISRIATVEHLETGLRFIIGEKEWFFAGLSGYCNLVINSAGVPAFYGFMPGYSYATLYYGNKSMSLSNERVIFEIKVHPKGDIFYTAYYDAMAHAIVFQIAYGSPHYLTEFDKIREMILEDCHNQKNFAAIVSNDVDQVGRICLSGALSEIDNKKIIQEILWVSNGYEESFGVIATAHVAVEDIDSGEMFHRKYVLKQDSSPQGHKPELEIEFERPLIHLWHSRSEEIQSKVENLLRKKPASV